jgi:hypothetical protein
MIKWIIVVVIGLAIWGGFTDSISFKDDKGNYTISMNKQKALISLENGVNKVKTLVENIDKVVEDNQKVDNQKNSIEKK